MKNLVKTGLNFLYRVIKVNIENNNSYNYKNLLHHNAIRAILKKAGINKENIYISDGWYKFLPQNLLKNFLEYNLYTDKKYIKEIYDCDNFSFSLMGMASHILNGFAFGIIWVTRKDRTKHALNFFIDEDGELFYIEPQNNEVFQDPTYKPYFAIM